MRLRHALLAALVLPSLSPNVQADTVTDFAVGKKGLYLKIALQKHCSPTGLCQEDIILEAMQRISNQSDGKIIDCLTGEIIDLDSDMPVVHALVSPAWYAVDPDLAGASSLDLFNLLLTSSETIGLRQSFPLYDVGSPVQGNGIWSFGFTMYNGDDSFTCFQPHEKNKGAIARSIFYTITMYPATLWSGWGETIFLNDTYPTASEFALSCYLKWHREYPVTDSEQARNSAIETIQGNRNPFVDYPELVEYLWGLHAGDTFGVSDPEIASEMPLQPSYPLSGPDIMLRSPYIPADAKWTVDGSSIESDRISPTTLGAGKHEFIYSSQTEKGKLIINITE